MRFMDVARPLAQRCSRVFFPLVSLLILWIEVLKSIPCNHGTTLDLDPWSSGSWLLCEHSRSLACNLSHLRCKPPPIKIPIRKSLIKVFVTPNEIKPLKIPKPTVYVVERGGLSCWFWMKNFKSCTFGVVFKDQKLKVTKENEISVYGSPFFRTGIGTSDEIWSRRRWLRSPVPEVLIKISSNLMCKIFRSFLIFICNHVSLGYISERVISFGLCAMNKSRTCPGCQTHSPWRVNTIAIPKNPRTIHRCYLSRLCACVLPLFEMFFHVMCLHYCVLEQKSQKLVEMLILVPLKSPKPTFWCVYPFILSTFNFELILLLNETLDRDTILWPEQRTIYLNCINFYEISRFLCHSFLLNCQDHYLCYLTRNTNHEYSYEYMGFKYVVDLHLICMGLKLSWKLVKILFFMDPEVVVCVGPLKLLRTKNMKKRIIMYVWAARRFALRLMSTKLQYSQIVIHMIAMRFSLYSCSLDLYIHLENSLPMQLNFDIFAPS